MKIGLHKNMLKQDFFGKMSQPRKNLRVMKILTKNVKFSQSLCLEFTYCYVKIKVRQMLLNNQYTMY